MQSLSLIYVLFWLPGRDRGSETGGKTSGIGLSGLGQRCGELIAQGGSPRQALLCRAIQTGPGFHPAESSAQSHKIFIKLPSNHFKKVNVLKSTQYPF